MSNTTDVEARVACLLQEFGITYTVRLVGETVRDDWTCDEWRVTIRNKAGKEFKTDYYTGVGHRETPTGIELGRIKYKFPGLNARDIAGRTIYGRRYLQAVEAAAKAKAPCAASILACLLRDGEAIDQSFDDWCNERGCDQDSRKAFNTYEGCCKTGRGLRGVFTNEQRQALKDTLQDY